LTGLQNPSSVDPLSASDSIGCFPISVPLEGACPRQPRTLQELLIWVSTTRSRKDWTILSILPSRETVSCPGQALLLAIWFLHWISRPMSVARERTKSGEKEFRLPSWWSESSQGTLVRSFFPRERGTGDRSIWDQGQTVKNYRIPPMDVFGPRTGIGIVRLGRGLIGVGRLHPKKSRFSWTPAFFLVFSKKPPLRVPKYSLRVR
jgi:hypothetical protein